MTNPEDYIFSMQLKVRDYEVDSQGIVNNANYLHYFEHTRHEFCDARGFTFAQMQAAGTDPVVRRIEVDYMNPLHLGETMTSALSIERRGARFLFHQDIFTPDGRYAARAVVTIVALQNGAVSRGDALASALGIE